MASVCIFCKRGPVTKEHVLPAWLKEALPIVGAVEVHIGGEDGDPAWRMASLDQMARIVCLGCNTGWMSDLETFCSPRLSPVIGRGAPLSLSPTEQRQVAAWAVKTVLTLQAGFPAFRGLSYSPEDHLRWMHERKTTPPPGTFVWLFHAIPFNRNGTLFRGAFARTASLVLGDQQWTGEREQPNAYLATISVGHLGLQVFGRDSPIDGLVRWLTPGGYWRDALVAIWPPTLPRAGWPPIQALTLADMNLLSSWGQTIA